MNNPISTYRIQFQKNFTFRDFQRIIPYLHQLGVRTLYASPIFEAVPGSQHGYDCVNPQRINPEIGTEAELKAISQALAERNMQWIQDIVPNHMGFHPNNQWLMDVLEKGQLSLYASFFDIDWTSPVHKGRLMVPFLSSSLDETIEKGELTIAYQNGRLVLAYYDTAYPLHIRSYVTVLQDVADKVDVATQQLIDTIQGLSQPKDPVRYAQQVTDCQQKLAELMETAPSRAAVKRRLGVINKTPELLQLIADEQVYRLCSYTETDHQINYRRFFTVNGLICLNIQDEAVFNAVHALPKALLEAGVFHGLRIDHIDGLYDPTYYLERLRQLAGPETYIVVEKILQNDEPLPSYWPIQGATGYSYLSMVNNLFTRTRSEASFTRFYQQLLGEKIQVRRELRDKKAYILSEHMQGELTNLYRLFLSLKLVSKEALQHVSSDTLQEAIGEFLVQCPVYRYYGNQMPLEQSDVSALVAIFDRIQKRKPSLTPAIDLLRESLLAKPQECNQAYKSRALRFYQRCMQFTGPLMAKGVEDTLMYTYNRFIGHDEVGDSPDYFGLTVEAFHQKMVDRQQQWPLALNATSTHDTKRGEDVRCRLNVLTDLTDEWIDHVQSWQQLTADLKQSSEAETEKSPDANDEYFIYQTLIGAYPMPSPSATADSPLTQEEADFPERLTMYLQKAMREAKRNSDYAAPNEAYEEATQSFAIQLLDRQNPFWASFRTFHQRVADFGILNSLSQTVLKCTCPGLPDIYQGCEGWDLSLVDPDNRRPVDFSLRQQWLKKQTTDEDGSNWPDLWENRYDARIKFWLLHRLLTERKQHPDLFVQGHYVPLAVEGRYSKHVIAYARRYQHTWLVVVLPLGLAQLCDDVGAAINLDWADTRIVLPPDAPKQWQSLLQRSDESTGLAMSVADLFATLPLAVIKGEKKHSERSAGLLMPITSLPAPFGVGDLGPEAYEFANFLSRSQQRYWQLLPLNPVAAECGFSPYSAIASMAGDPLLISPALLVKERLLEAEELALSNQPPTSQIDFENASQLKKELLAKAYARFQRNQSASQQAAFYQFCEQEASWLDDYALYITLKEEHNQQPWYQWPRAYKLRQAKALATVRRKKEETIREVMWYQFVFDQQWKALKQHCDSLGVRLFGDLPFYVNYDSTDVWSHPDLFSLDKEGNMTKGAGVPPDYFNPEGQSWRMPLFRWDRLKKQNYAWWIERLRKNMERYDWLRLDHFRAFASYWEVDANESTARNGQWVPGPGADFFNVVKAELGDLPFVAEDLGKIDADVYALRDEFDLPGMQVLQFAFGENMAHTVNSLHHHRANAITYTGTHDNNTCRGWYRQDTERREISQLEHYVGHGVTEEDVHLVLARLAYASVANVAILPLPDVLGLDESARINNPGSSANNWRWRLLPQQLTPALEQQLREWATIYDRSA